MTAQETTKLIFVMRSMWPRAYKDMTAQDFQNNIAAWQFALEDYSYEQASIGLKIYMQSSKGFPPDSGQIVECIRKAKPENAPQSVMTEEEAWQITLKAMGSFSWNDDGSIERAFNRLPKACQRAVGGTVQAFKEAAGMDMASAEWAAFTAKFARSYTEAKKQDQEFQKLPAKVREAIQIATQKNDEVKRLESSRSRTSK